MDKYDAIIIGAGIAGLTCGCYLAKQGLKVLILEKQDKPGGYCSSFQKGPYLFDAGVHYLGGIKTGLLGKIFDELEVNRRLHITQFDPADKIVLPDNIVYIRANPQDTIREFMKSFPQEKHNIETFFKFILELNFLDIFTRVKKLSFQQLLDKYFSCTKLKTALCLLLNNIGIPANKITALTALALFKEFILDPGYYPGQSMQSLPDTLADIFQHHGGRLFLSRKVDRIITEAGKVKAVTAGQETIMADIVISNADATKTFQKLLDTKQCREAFTVNNLTPSVSVFALYLGLKKSDTLIKETCNIWYFSTYDLEQFYSSLKKSILQKYLPGLMISFPSTHRDIKNTPGCVTALISAPYESKQFWDKQRDILTEKMLDKINELVPDIKQYIDMKVNATPRTFEKYTANKNGAIYGWAPTMEQTVSSLLPQQTSVPGLFLTGHWCTKSIGVGCISGAASMGRNAAKIILENKGYKWQYPLFFRER